MGEPAGDRERMIAQARSAAEAFAAGRDGTELAPPEIRARVAAWKERLAGRGEELDGERWLLGLLTLVCLSQGDRPPNHSMRLDRAGGSTNARQG